MMANPFYGAMGGCQPNMMQMLQQLKANPIQFLQKAGFNVPNNLNDPNANTCIKLAAFLTIQREMHGKNEPNQPITPRYSYAAEPSEQVETTIDYYSDTEFSKAIDGRQAADIWPIMDELVSVLQATNTRLYNGVMRKIEN